MQVPQSTILGRGSVPAQSAPDGSTVSPLLRTPRCSVAEFWLAAGAVSRAVRHRSVEEVWHVLSGRGEMWCSENGSEKLVALRAGVVLTLAAGVAFQFYAHPEGELRIIGVTMPPWPLKGAEEAEAVDGCWVPTV